MYKCQYCDCEHETEGELQQHLEIHYSCFDINIHLPHRCDICVTSFMTPELLTRHRNSVHNLMCFWCSTHFKSTTDLTEHEKIHDIDEELPSTSCLPIDNRLPFRCVSCTSRFRTLELLERHKNSEHNKRCQYCGSIHVTESELKDHEEFHISFFNINGHLPFCCESCNTSFTTLDLLDKHRNSVHHLVCFWCLTKYKSKEELTEHEKIHNIDEEPQPKRFKLHNQLETSGDNDNVDSSMLSFQDQEGKGLVTNKQPRASIASNSFETENADSNKLEDNINETVYTSPITSPMLNDQTIIEKNMEPTSTASNNSEQADEDNYGTTNTNPSNDQTDAFNDFETANTTRSNSQTPNDPTGSENNTAPNNSEQTDEDNNETTNTNFSNDQTDAFNDFETANTRSNSQTSNDETESENNTAPNNSVASNDQADDPQNLQTANEQMDIVSPIAGPSTDNHNITEIAYNVRKVNQKTYFKSAAIDRHYKVKFDVNKLLEGRKLSNLNKQLQHMFDKLLREVKEGLQGNDLGRIVINHPDLVSNIVVPLQQLDELSGEKVLTYIANVLNSHENLPFEKDMTIDIGTIELPKGGTGHSLPINNLTGPNSSLHRKRSIIEIKNCDNTCMARSVLLGWLKINVMGLEQWKVMTVNDTDLSIEDKVLKYKACPNWYYLLIKKQNHRLTDIVHKIYEQMGISTLVPMGLNDIYRFEEFFNVDVLVVSSRLNNKFVRVAPKESQKQRLYIYLVENLDVGHFHTIVNICGFFAQSKFCETCLKPYQKKHSCEVSCFVCNSRNCKNQEDQVSCRSCHMTCRSLDCFQRHLDKKRRQNKPPTSQCELYWKCIECKKVVETSKRKIEDHRCGYYECKSCDRMVSDDHLCYIRALNAKESNGKFIFFDIETTQNEIWQCSNGYVSDKRLECAECKPDRMCNSCSRCKNCSKSICGKFHHQANLIIAHKCCPTCMDEPLLPHSKCEDCGTRCKSCNKFNSIDKVYDSPPCQATCGFRETIFKGDNCINDFGQFLFSPTHKHFCVLGHNLRAFDGYFLLEYLIDQSMRPNNIIFAGSKINFMHVANGLDIRIIDSLNFLPMPLSQLPTAFSLEELRKGYFPHYFNKRENANYVGPYPEPKYYGVDSMSAENRTKFYCWYLPKWHPDSVFDFQKEIVEYCRSDVDILRRACLKFREILMSITGTKMETLNENLDPITVQNNAIDPFNEITIASVCSKVYRTKFLEETWQAKLRCDGKLTDWLPAKKLNGEFTFFIDNKWVTEKDLLQLDMIIEEKEFLRSPIAQIPSNGYAVDKFSKVSIRWLEWEMEKNNRIGNPIFIQHGHNKSEYHLPQTNYRLDGYCSSTNTAYEFYGCLWHGCKVCYPAQRHFTKNPRTKQSLEELYTLTMKKQDYIRSIGMNLVYIWEHEFVKLLETESTVKEFVESLDLQDRLDPRDSFFGGRTNAISLLKEVTGEQKIRFTDFCSLYPYCNKYSIYPINHPQILTSDLDKIDINNIFGIVKCKILAPRKLYFPVLPMKCNDKLTFPLCKTCAENQSQTPCTCSDEKRMLLGTWCSPEILKAVELGYKIVKIYEIYHWPETTQFNPITKSGGLFSDYIDMFLKIKQESSGWPSWVKTEQDILMYIELYSEKEGIHLDREKIEHNKALRSLAKLLLNSMWGKWGQNLNMIQTVYFHETEANKFFQCVSDPQKSVKDFYVVTNDIIQVTFNQKEAFVSENYQNNVFLATFTTCAARLKLYDVLFLLQDRVLYHDTDSVMYITDNTSVDPPVGDFLGELTSELDQDEFITKFCAGGPKQYAYLTSKGKQVCKIRGFTLNYTNQKLLNFDSMFDLITRPNDNESEDSSRQRPWGTNSTSISVFNNKICRDKKERKLYNRCEEKKYKIVYSKRVIDISTFKTFPYGY